MLVGEFRVGLDNFWPVPNSEEFSHHLMVVGDGLLFRVGAFLAAPEPAGDIRKLILQVILHVRSPLKVTCREILIWQLVLMS
ncbi:hypothetical protein DRW03_03535 [Corallococcus sp. H22C18031201]|nr:hypothetical protein DRW03_03535 [Corallococcus sp. H22C18031201]